VRRILSRGAKKTRLSAARYPLSDATAYHRGKAGDSNLIVTVAVSKADDSGKRLIIGSFDAGIVNSLCKDYTASMIVLST